MASKRQMFVFNKFKKKYLIKIPQNVTVLYCDQKNILTIINPLKTKTVKLKVKLFFSVESSLIIVTNIPISGTSAADLKSVKKTQGTAVAKIKQVLIEMSYTLYCKLNLTGVGYRVFDYEHLKNQLYFKLGYSHLVYFQIPNTLKTHCQKFTKLFIFGDHSFEDLTQTAALVRACKAPEPYKGKGILYDQEKVVLKKGKKI